jgi:hypothetical protein
VLKAAKEYFLEWGLTDPLVNSTRHNLAKYIREIRIAYWAQLLKWTLNVRSKRQLAKELEPDSFRSGINGPFHHNKWPGYLSGRHLPGTALVVSCDQRVPGSEYAINHAMWRILLDPRHAVRNARALLMEFEPNLQRFIFTASRSSRGKHRERRPITRQLLLQLEKNASLDALACATIFLLEAHDAGDKEACRSRMSHVWRILLILGAVDRPMACLGDHFFKVYFRSILSGLEFAPLYAHELGPSPFLRFDHEGIDYQGYCAALRVLIYAKEGHDVSKWVESSTATATASRMLNGDYGWDIPLAFRVPYRPVVPEGPENVELYTRLLHDERLRQWGMSLVFGYERESQPPAELMRGRSLTPLR